MEGQIKTGLGEAEFWVSKIKKFFKEKYNMDLVLGTLNVELDDEFILKTDEIIPKEEYGRTI